MTKEGADGVARGPARGAVLDALYASPPAYDGRYLTEVLRLPAARARTLAGAGGGIPAEERALLQELVAAREVVSTLEVGLGFGYSALAICDAARSPAHRHVVVDAYQHTHWGGAGLRHLEVAGHGPRVEFHEGPSHRVLPQLEAAGHSFEFAFIDGWHTFDAVMVDFFYVDRMLPEGGVVAFDDADWPSVGSVVRFALANLDYRVVACLPPSASIRARTWRAARALTSAVLRLGGGVPGWREVLPRLFTAEARGLDARHGLGGRFVALEKTGPDRRDVFAHVRF